PSLSRRSALPGSVVAIGWNRWSRSVGIRGRVLSNSVVGIARTEWSRSSEYAADGFPSTARAFTKSLHDSSALWSVLRSLANARPQAAAQAAPPEILARSGV